MASYEIPEEIIGVPLFVPDGNDYFEIVPGGMPNGDSCLRVRGDLSTNYKAFQPAPTTSPNISADGTEWALTFWIKAPTTGSLSGGFTSIIISMMNADKDNVVFDANSLFAVSGAGTSVIGFSRGVSGLSTRNISLSAAGARDGSWHLINFNVPGPSSTGAAHIDNEDTPQTTDTQTLSDFPNANQFLCIGSYSPLAGPTALASDYQIGKIAFHDHMLNQTERSLLWEAMTP